MMTRSSWSWPCTERPLGVSTPTNDEGHILDADDLAQWVFSREELVGHGLADDGHLAGAAHVLSA